jgi:hypothetical protein
MWLFHSPWQTPHGKDQMRDAGSAFSILNNHPSSLEMMCQKLPLDDKKIWFSFSVASQGNPPYLSTLSTQQLDALGEKAVNAGADPAKLQQVSKKIFFVLEKLFIGLCNVHFFLVILMIIIAFQVVK